MIEHDKGMSRLPAITAGFVLFAPLCSAQFLTKLQPRTVDEFELYAQKVELELQQRWDGKRSFLALDQNQSERDKVMRAELWVGATNAGNPIHITDGLIHDWTGDVFIPHVDIRKVVVVLQDFDRQSNIYPDVKRSRVVSRNGDNITGFWELQRSQGPLMVVLDVTQDVHWQQIAPGKWVCRAYAKNIQEVEDAGSKDKKVFPAGEGSGFLWRMYAYWTIEAIDGGVLAECRTLSLSRDIPPALAWVIDPFVRSLPRNALASTLSETRKAVEQ